MTVPVRQATSTLLSTSQGQASWSSVSVAGDSRITPFGATLRHYKLDELIPLRGLFLVRTSAMLKSGFGIAFGLASVVQDCGRLRK